MNLMPRLFEDLFKKTKLTSCSAASLGFGKFYQTFRLAVSQAYFLRNFFCQKGGFFTNVKK
jgi:hypothetical protein